VGPTTSTDRETLDVDILIVGGDPAGLAAALRLSQLQQGAGGEGPPLQIAILEKAREAGAHMLSGAVLDPSTLRELLPDFKERGAPLSAEVHDEDVLLLTESSKIALPIIPPPLRNHGNYVISLNQFVQWLTSQVEAAGIDFFSGFAGQDVLMEGERVIGVRTGDRGIDKHGQPKATFEPGVDIRAKVTIFCDGVRGNLTKELIRRLQLGDADHPQQFAIGLKELWEVPQDRLKPGTVIHTLGYPLKHEEFGGAFIYAMPQGQLSVGFVAGLDYKDPLFDPHMAFNRFKQHPYIASLLAGGQMIRYGAKALPEGGWNTIPRVYMDGALIAGDAGAFLNSMRLKGIHLAMRTGMLAAETAFEAVRSGDTSVRSLKAYQDRIDRSAVRAELYPVRNVHQAFGYGLFPGLAFAGLSVLTHGWLPEDLHGHPGHARMQMLAWYYGSRQMAVSGPSNATTVDRRLTFDKVTNVHFSGTAHDEDQPSHLLVHTEVCSSMCGPEYGHPCIRFCPANVYEIAHEADGTPRLQINASNCVHCKTCDIMDPYQVITWVPPEGGGGPQYNGM
jgi:electron-transferring-flavoprotein dehydrogenase